MVLRLINKLLARWADELERNRGTWLVLVGLLYGVLVLLRSFRPLWFDELYTYNVAGLTSPALVWDALSRGADSNPPLLYLITRLSAMAFGSTEFGLRVPSILGFFVLIWSLNRFVSLRAGTVFGFAAMLVPLVTGAFYYASEARAYGLVLGFTGMAVASWQSAASGPRKRLWLSMMAATLAGALLTHCYAVLVLAPLGVAQVVRDLRRRRFDWPAWVCLTLPLSACLTYLPLLTTIQRYQVDNPVFRPTWHSIPDFYQFLMGPALWPLFLGAVGVAVAAARARGEEGDSNSEGSAEEIALGAGFLVLPALAVLLAALATRVYMERYALTAVIGMTILLAQAASKLSGRSRRLGAGLFLLFAGWAILKTASDFGRSLSEPAWEAVSLDQRPELPLVISSGLVFYEMNHYAPPQVAERMWFLTDEEKGTRLTGSNVFDRGLPLLNGLFPFRAKLADYESFLKQNRRFLVYGYSRYDTDWVVPQLRRDGVRLNYLGQRKEMFGTALLFEAERP